MVETVSSYTDRPIHPFISRSIHLCIHTFIHPCIDTSIYPYILASIHLYILAPIHPYVYTSSHPYIHIYTSIRPSIRPSVPSCTSMHVLEGLPFYSRPEAGLLNKSSCLVPTLGVYKFIKIIERNLVSLWCVASVRHRCSTNPSLVQVTRQEYLKNRPLSVLYFSMLTCYSSLSCGNFLWRKIFSALFGLKGGRLSTVDLLIKVACSVKKGKQYFQYKKKQILTSLDKQANCTERSPSVRVPW